MDAKSDVELKLRAHHICCAPFMTRTSERGTEFLEIKNIVKQILNSEPDARVMVIEGVDDVCGVCPLCKEGRCESPDGSEEKVRKWDAILLRELGLSFGDVLTVRQWLSLFDQKWPFQICQKCQWRKVCRVSSING